MFRSKLKVKYIKGTSDPKMYVLKSGLIFENIVVYAGFKTDLATIPKCIQWLYTPQGKYSKACVVHDFLYADPNCPKDVADETFFRAMKASGVDIITRHVFYWAVKYFGQEFKNVK